MEGSISTILFDLGGTLISMGSVIREGYWERAILRAAQHLQESGYDLSPEDLDREYSDITEAYREFTLKTLIDVDRRLQLSSALNRLGLPTHPRDKIITRLLREIYKEVLEETSLYPDAIETVKLLRERFKLGLVTNNSSSDHVYWTLDKLRMRHLFNTITISAEVGLRKPCQGIFSSALKRIRSLPSETVFIGDSEPSDILGAKTVGMRTILIDRKPELQLHSTPDAVIDELRQIPIIIEEWAQ